MKDRNCLIWQLEWKFQKLIQIINFSIAKEPLWIRTLSWQEKNCSFTIQGYLTIFFIEKMCIIFTSYCFVHTQGYQLSESLQRPKKH